jgi:uncharacterized protein YkwD
LKKRLIALILSIGLVLGALPVQAQSPDSIYDEVPDVSRCEPGRLQAREKEAVLDLVNSIRALHDLEPVVYDERFDDEVAQASLMIVANNDITHYPPPTAGCYTRVGAEGAATSNLLWSFPIKTEDDPLLPPSTADVRGWLIDPDVPELGHRRWLLNPFLNAIAYGRVDGPPLDSAGSDYAHGSALKISGSQITAPPRSAPAFVAYPYRDYPLDLFEIGWYWSFSVVVDAENYRGNRSVDFSNAQVRVRQGGRNLRVNEVAFNNDNIGLANFLQWQVEGVDLGPTYQVTISNVLVEGTPRRYSYQVRLTPPDLGDFEPTVYTLEHFNETLNVRAGELFALYAPPPARIPRHFNVSRRGMNVQMTDHSPYITLFRFQGTIGDEAMLPFDEDAVTLRITETATGLRNPLTALRLELGIPVYKVAGRGETFTAAAGSRIALYVPPDVTEQGVRRVNWSQPRSTELNVEFFNARVLILEITEGLPGDEATVRFSGDKQFNVRVSER